MIGYFSTFSFVLYRKEKNVKVALKAKESTPAKYEKLPPLKHREIEKTSAKAESIYKRVNTKLLHTLKTPLASTFLKKIIREFFKGIFYYIIKT